MKTNKLVLTDLLTQVKDLNKKFDIDQFSTETKDLFRKLKIDESTIDAVILNPVSGIAETINADLNKLDQTTLQQYVKDYKDLKKKYHYEDYVKEGHVLRKVFLHQRKNYMFNSTKFIKFEANRRMSPLEKLNVDYAEQYFIAKWIDKLLKKAAPRTLNLEYEDLNGKTKKAEIAYHKYTVEMDPEGVVQVEAPLIDRFVGSSLFDSFLLHSFWNVKTKMYQYVPVKFIISMRASDLEEPDIE